MSNVRNGEVDWDVKDDTVQEKTGGKDLFLRLNPGSNIIRILTNPFQYMQHRWKPEGGAKYGYRVNCSKTTDKASTCPCCEAGDVPKKRWLIGVIDRKTNMYKVLDIGGMIYKDLKKYSADPDWGDKLMTYDVDVIVDPQGGVSSYYSIISKPKKPLSISDLQLKEDNDPADLDRRTQPPTPEKVQEKMDRVLEDIGTAVNGVSASLANSSTKEDDDFFPNFDTAKK